MNVLESIKRFLGLKKKKTMQHTPSRTEKG